MKVQFIDANGGIISAQELKPKNFKPNENGESSCGFNGHGKLELPDGNRLQISLNLIAVGSRDWSDKEKANFLKEN